jgi:hypothetical protein
VRRTPRVITTSGAGAAAYLARVIGFLVGVLTGPGMRG